MKNKKHIYMLLIFLVFMITISAVSAADDGTSDINSIEEEHILDEPLEENNLNEEINLEKNNQNEEINLEENTPNEEIILEENNQNEEINLEENNLNESDAETNLNLKKNTLLKANDNELLNAMDDNVPLSESPGNFRDLDSLINGNTDPEITLDRNYVYSESDNMKSGVTINRAVTINGNGFILNGDTKARIFNVTNSDVVFKNITFQGGWSEYSSNGGAICGASTAINCTFKENRATEGGAIYGGTAINCTFTNNNAIESGGDGKGGAISMGTAINCSFTNNNAQCYGGALYYTIARNCNFTNNYGKYSGGAMFGSYAINCHFENNTMDDDENPNNAICQVFALNCTFTNNGADDYSTVVNNAYFNITNFTGRINDEDNSIYMKLFGFRDEVEVIYDVDCTLRVYKDGVLNETRNLKSSRSWKIDLPAGNYTATVGIDNIPEVEIAEFTIKLSKKPSRINAENITAVYKNETYWNVRFENAENYWAIVHSGVSIDIDGNITTDETDNSGYIYIPLKDLSIGNHTATISMTGHSEFEDVSASFTISIIKIPTVIECDNPFITIYNTSENFTIRLTDIYGNPVKAVELNIDLFPEGFFPTNDDGYAFVSETYLKKLAGGNYTAKISFPGTANDIYGPAETKNISIKIEKQNTTLSSDDEITTTFNSDEKIVATIINQQGNPISDIDISVDLIDGKTFKTDENGKVEIPLNLFAAGEQEATIIFDGNENYTESSYSIHITVNKDNPALSANPVTTSIENEDFLIISLKDSQNRPIANKKLIVCIDDFKESITDANGEVNVSTKDLEINTYNVFILFNGDENYTASNTTTMINITKGTPVLETFDCNVPWGEMALINITLKDKAGNPISGLVKVYLNVEDEGYIDYVTTDENGKGQAKILAILTQGKHEINATFLGNENYTSVNSSNSSNLTITESNKMILEINASEAKFGEDTILSIIVKDIQGQTIIMDNLTISINNGEATIYKITDGAINLGKLAVGSNNITVNSSDLEKYNFTGITLTAKVNPGTPDITLTPGDASLTIEVKDNNNPISGNAKIYIDGETEAHTSVPINETGQVTVDLSDLSIGNHAVEVEFTNENYTTTRKTTALNIPKSSNASVTISVSPNSIKENESAIVNVTLKAGENNLDGTVIVTVGNTPYAVTVRNGEKSLTLENLKAGEYTISAKFIGNDEYEEAIGENQTLKVNATPSDQNGTDQNGTDKNGTNPNGNAKSATAIAISPSTTITYNKLLDSKNNYYILATLKDAKGKELSNKTVQYTIDGKVYTAKTDSNGQIRFVFAQAKKGQYTVAVSFLGDDEYNGSFASISVKVNPQKVKLTASKKTFKAKKKTKKLTATLKNSKGKAIKGKKITFVVNKKKYTAKTNKKGVATVKVKLSKKKTYKVTVNFAGDNTYSKATKKTSVKIK